MAQFGGLLFLWAYFCVYVQGSVFPPKAFPLKSYPSFPAKKFYGKGQMMKKGVGFQHYSALRSPYFPQPTFSKGYYSNKKQQHPVFKKFPLVRKVPYVKKVPVYRKVPIYRKIFIDKPVYTPVYKNVPVKARQRINKGAWMNMPRPSGGFVDAIQRPIALQTQGTDVSVSPGPNAGLNVNADLNIDLGPSIGGGGVDLGMGGVSFGPSIGGGGVDLGIGGGSLGPGSFDMNMNNGGFDLGLGSGPDLGLGGPVDFGGVDLGFGMGGVGDLGGAGGVALGLGGVGDLGLGAGIDLGLGGPGGFVDMGHQGGIGVGTAPPVETVLTSNIQITDADHVVTNSNTASTQSQSAGMSVHTQMGIHDADTVNLAGGGPGLAVHNNNNNNNALDTLGLDLGLLGQSGATAIDLATAGLGLTDPGVPAGVGQGMAGPPGGPAGVDQGLEQILAGLSVGPDTIAAAASHGGERGMVMGHPVALVSLGDQPMDFGHGAPGGLHGGNPGHGTGHGPAHGPPGGAHGSGHGTGHV